MTADSPHLGAAKSSTQFRGFMVGSLIRTDSLED